MKLKVLLVDDEYIVLKGLEIMLESQTETDLEIVSAMDAVDAMDKISGWYPDVIIADINMPEIDGLSMLEQISARLPLCRFIIASGHEDQEYLMRTLKLHVADYLTKPIDKAYLIRRLKEISCDLQAQNRHVLLLIRMMLFQGNHSPVQEITLEKIRRLFPSPGFALCTVPLSLGEAQAKQARITAYFESCHIFAQNNWSVFLLNYSARIGKEEISGIFREILPGISCGISLFWADTETWSPLPELSVHLQAALCGQILSLRTLLPAIRVLMFEDSISDYLNDACDPDVDPSENFLLIFAESLSAYTLTAGIALPTETILQLYHSQSGCEGDNRSFAAFLEKTLNFWYDSITPTEHASYSSKIASACEYMNSRYAEDISLEQTAESVSINPSYLSYIFKKETGITFLQYLTNIRLQKACELMRKEPGLSLDAVSAATGYHSASYFHKIFRGKFGMSPRQWLQRERKDEG